MRIYIGKKRCFFEAVHASATGEAMLFVCSLPDLRLVTLYLSVIQGDISSAYLISNRVRRAADFFGDFVSGPVVFQTELNQNSLGARKMFPFLCSVVVECT